MTANDKESYLSYLNKLVDEYSNTYDCFISKEPVDADYSALIIFFILLKKFDRVIKLLNVITKIFPAKVTPKIRQKKYLPLILRWILILRRIKFKF